MHIKLILFEGFQVNINPLDTQDLTAACIYRPRSCSLRMLSVMTVQLCQTRASQVFTFKNPFIEI